MKILIVSEFGQCSVTETPFIPRIGDMVDMFYRPYPTVKPVLLYPKAELFREMKAENQDIVAIVTVS